MNIFDLFKKKKEVKKEVKKEEPKNNRTKIVWGRDDSVDLDAIIADILEQAKRRNEIVIEGSKWTSLRLEKALTNCIVNFIYIDYDEGLGQISITRPWGDEDESDDDDSDDE